MKSNRNPLPYLALLSTFVLPAISMGQTVTPSAGANTTSNWMQEWNTSGGGVTMEGGFNIPSGGNAIINSGRTLQVDTSVLTTAPQVIINNGPLGTNAFLEINAGGTLTTGNFIVSGNVGAGSLKVQGGTLTVNGNGLDVRTNGVTDVSSGTLNSNQTIKVSTGANFNATGGNVNVTASTGSAIDLSGGVFNISSGLVKLNDPSPGGSTFDAISGGGTLNLTGGSLELAGATGASDTIQFGSSVINISGGTLKAVGGQVIATGNPVFNINGDDATIELDRLNLGLATRATTFNFNFDETGVSSIGASGGSYATLTHATVNIDGALYTGGPATFDLFTHSNIAALAPTVNITNFGVEGVDYTFEQSTTENIFRLTVVSVPEPSSLACLSLACAGLAFRRRR